jgi:hypothetical protein
MQFSKGELGGAVNRHKQVQLAFFSSHLGYVDMKIANGVLLKTLILRSPVAYLRQATNPISLQTTMQGGLCEVWIGLL